MKYEYLTIDFETKDPFIGALKMGSGWAYSNNRDFKVLGMSAQFPGGASKYIKTKAAMRKLLAQTNTLIVFNANYDIGIVHSLGIDIREYTIIDVLVMAKMFNSVEESHSLNFLSKKYLNDKKTSTALGEAAVKLGLVKSKAQSAISVAMQNMDLIQETYPELVEEYAIHDTKLTYDLYKFFALVDGYDVDFYSDLTKALILARARGVRIDLIQLLRLEAEFQIKVMDAQLELNNMNGGEPVNTSSPNDVPQFLISHGVNLKENDKGNYVCDKATLESLDHKAAKAVLKVRKLKKLLNDFIIKIIEMQKYTIKATRNDFGSKVMYGYIYPEITIFGAAATGRSSSQGPNIQQIPARSEEGRLIRSIVVCDEGYDKIAACDFSAQEPRLIINDAARIGARSIQKFIDKFNNDSNADFHQIAADTMKVERDIAKTIGLGLLYGMGDFKLSQSLDISVEEAKFYKELYFKSLPFMSELIDSMSKSLKSNGYIKTIGGNKLMLDPETSYRNKIQTYEFKAINKRIQGSAAYQTNKALVDMYRACINFMFPVHDEIVFSANEGDAERVSKIMEDAYKMVIPSKAEPAIGDNWSQCK